MPRIYNFLLKQLKYNIRKVQSETGMLAVLLNECKTFKTALKM